MSLTLMVTSLKGGVGKTTFASALAYAAAVDSRRAVCVDMDLGSGGLDIALGAENSLGANVIDVFRGEADPKSALVCCGGIPELTLIPSPLEALGTYPDVTPE
ncbi:MAG: AAA family ATPase, partial [Clostridia bacterium]|nr:AAA family ATPase [Clostridia bacterium]